MFIVYLMVDHYTVKRSRLLETVIDKRHNLQVRRKIDVTNCGRY